jgi:hypothetical protein
VARAADKVKEEGRRKKEEGRRKKEEPKKFSALLYSFDFLPNSIPTTNY